jgi:cytosine/adenosine deaminase-related metal-dependent hydrolase
MPFDASRAVFEEAEKLGVRMVLCRGGQTMSRAMTDADAPPQVSPETLDGFLASVERDVHNFHDPSPTSMRRVVSAITTPSWSCSPDQLREMARAARALGIRLHSHLSESFDYVRWAQDVHGCTPMQFVAEHEWVGSDVWFAHMVHLSDDEIAMCARTGTGIAHCPQSNARLGSGIARIPEAMAAGVPIGLAVDGAASNEAADMTNEAHACWLLHRADPRSGERPDARAHSSRVMQPGGHAGAMTAEDVVHLGTVGGARVLGLDGVGSIAVGMAADLVLYDLDHPRYFGMHDPASGPVVCGGQPSLKAVLVQGRVVVENGTIPGLDLSGLRREAQAFVDRTCSA